MSDARNYSVTCAVLWQIDSLEDERLLGWGGSCGDRCSAEVIGGRCKLVPPMSKRSLLKQVGLLPGQCDSPRILLSAVLL